MAERFFWYELLTSDLDAALFFYRDVVGWTAEDHPGAPGGMRYAILSANGRGVGGAMALTDEMRAGGARPGWLGYIAVADVDAKAKDVAGAGGRVLMEPADITGVGRFALVADPAGAPFYLMTPQPQGENPGPPDPASAGHVGWHELYTAQGQESAFAFYAGLFGWETVELMEMGAMGRYRLVGADGIAFGGMMDKPAPMPVSAWGFYFNVERLDPAVERVAAGGGTVLMGPHEVPGGNWIVQALDPQGAAFALVAPAR